MTHDEGPVPDGAGPSSSEELEAMRRRLYGRGVPSSAVTEYEVLASARPPEVSEQVSPAAPRRPRAPLLLASSAVVLGALGLVGTVQPVPVEQLDPPASTGSTIAAYGRAHDPAVGPGTTTYQPQGYTVFQPEGRVVHVAFRCAGAGSVRIAAGAVHRFRCGSVEQEFVRSDGRRRTAPFMVSGTTVGDVVWAVRVTLRDG